MNKFNLGEPIDRTGSSADDWVWLIRPDTFTRRGIQILPRLLPNKILGTRLEMFRRLWHRQVSARLPGCSGAGLGPRVRAGTR
jgi:hypothetical protein